jgi:ribosomal protein S18 acetylase RimI-like enzyme
LHAPGTRARLSRMNQPEVLAAFDAQMRRGTLPDGVGARVERAGRVLRQVAAEAGGWFAVVWSDLDEASADAAIAEQVRFFAGLGQTFEWKVYGYDLPVDLPRRLLAAGFVAREEEAIMVAEIADLDLDVAPPPGVRLVPVTDAAGAALLVSVHQEVFGTDHAWLGRALLAEIARAPDEVAAVVAMAGDRAVCSARAKLDRGRDFASLWGGGTLPAWRGRGIYRAVVAHRARLAAERGFRYLQVDASPRSRPILERLGFVALTSTTPYISPGPPNQA